MTLELRKTAACLLIAASAATLRAGSVWPAEGAGMVADHKAKHTGDIVTVVVQESANASSTQNKEATRKSSVNDAVQQFLFPPAVSGLGTHAGQLPSFQISGKSDYTGGGQVSNSQSLSSQAAVLVTDVLPNGNLVIEGVRLVSFSGETQYVVLHGLIRPDDIASNNTVLSSNIAEARVEFVNKGSLTQAENPGWLAHVYEFLRPF
ncbi:MAG TPA: flagellar basal body L-ring protein FlgH [Opitutaceae bacterium]|nr:flagellar basal body L-ring protein FlgH [Opitutaceae bacterium]